jgi:hypothetical protein
VETETVETLAAELMEDLGLPGRGIQLRRLAGGWRLETKPEHADAIVALKHNRTMKPLSEQAREAAPKVQCYSRPGMALIFSVFTGCLSATIASVSWSPTKISGLY